MLLHWHKHIWMDVWGVNNLYVKVDETSVNQKKASEMIILRWDAIAETHKLHSFANILYCYFCIENYNRVGGEDTKRHHVLCRSHKNAFNKVKHGILFEKLQHLDLHEKDLEISQSLYWNQSEYIKMDGECSDYTSIRWAVKQGCVMQPYLFRYYS